MIRPAKSEVVVLLHGLGAHRLVMVRLSHYLKAHGYQAANWGYRSIRDSIESHAMAFQQQLGELMSQQPYRRIHVVAHSMGSIIARRALGLARPAKLGRFVMLGPPNAGSHVARRLAPALGGLCPPLRELSDLPESYVNRLGELPGVELGVIAAAADRVVKLDSTSLACQRDHIVLPGHHGMLPWRRDTAEQTVHFLKHGRFNHGSDSRE